MPVNVVITAKVGTGVQATALPINGASGILFLPDRGIVQVLRGGDTNNPAMSEFEYSGTTITCAVSADGKTQTFTLSA